MGFRSFRVGVLIRLVLLTILLFLLVILFQDSTKVVTAGVVSFLVVIAIIELFRFITKTNRKLIRFFESIKYSDFSSGFTLDDSLGQSFKELNIAFTEVLDAFRDARSEKEENWQYLNTVIQQIKSGIISFDYDGNIKLINSSAKKFLGIPQIKNIDEIAQFDPNLFEILNLIKPGQSNLYRKDLKTQIAIRATEIIIRGETYKVVNLQNIQSELQQKEIESWQNLTRVLRHEIMNSITPIASLTSTMKDIIIEDLTQKEETFELPEETVDDLQEGLDTIESRSKGLIKFIDAYRDYTNIPQPVLSKVLVSEMIEHIISFNKVEVRKYGVDLSSNINPENMMIDVDEELMEQVLINLVKNAIEATEGRANPKVSINVFNDEDNHSVISIRDNGAGIIPEALERIFIPFYTTKEKGSGIGLALSRQIINMHNGTLTVDSKPEEYTEFVIKI